MDKIPPEPAPQIVKADHSVSGNEIPLLVLTGKPISRLRLPRMICALLKKTDIDLLALAGKQLRMRGWGKRDFRPMITVTDPHQIEILN